MLNEKPWTTLVKLLVLWIVAACVVSALLALFDTTYFCNPAGALKFDLLVWRAELETTITIPAALLIGGCLGFLQWRVMKSGSAQLTRAAVIAAALCVLAVVLYSILATHGAMPENCPF